MKKINSFRPKKLYNDILQQRQKDGERFSELYAHSFITIDCPACGNKGHFAFEKWGFEHRKCENCKTVFTSPRPTEDKIIEYYNDFEAPNMWTKLLLETDVDRKKMQYKPRVDLILNHIDVGRNTLFADIGAGSGAFCLALEQAGVADEVIALDVSDQCIDACKANGLKTIHGSVSDLDDGAFDLLTMNDLVEHLFNPESFLSECYKKLKPNGYLVIATPNGEGFDFKIMKEATLNITPPEHINYFNPNSIQLLMERVGFKDVEVITPGVLDVGIIERCIENGLELNENNEWLSYLFDQSEEVLNQFQKFLAENKLSSHMVIFAKK